MNLADAVRAIFALALTLGLVGLASVALRRFGPDALSAMIPKGRVRRLAVVETLILDPARRLVLVSCDGEEQLLLLGEGQALKSVPAQPTPQQTKAVFDA